jgi:hypothetical protein
MRDVIVSTDRRISHNVLLALKKLPTADALLQRVEKVP